MERKISAEYRKAEKEVAQKLNDYLRRFKVKDEKWQEWVADGKKTPEDYKAWRMSQIANGNRWEQLRSNLARDLQNANKIAKSIVNGYKPEVYAINHNYGTYEVETGGLVDTSYTLYSRETAERLMRDNPKMLPDPGKKVSQAIREQRAVRWDEKQIQSVMMQSLLQGESIPKIATRLATAVGDSDRKAAVRNARTMATGAQNAGRQDAYKRAEDMGVKMQREWIATLDMRTRHEHRMLDGERAAVDEPFVVPGTDDKIMYPGDPAAEPHMVYNCRCTTRAVVDGWESKTKGLRSMKDLEGMTYEEWKQSKVEKPNPILLPEEKAKAIRGSYIARYKKE